MFQTFAEMSRTALIIQFYQISEDDTGGIYNSNILSFANAAYITTYTYGTEAVENGEFGLFKLLS